jgi:hypothetical protein
VRSHGNTGSILRRRDFAALLMVIIGRQHSAKIRSWRFGIH